MTSEQFMANFGHIANAPGVGRLRDLIYHFAFAGELVAHSRETAAELAGVLAKAESPTGRTRRAMLEPAAGFYPIPPHWLWVNIGDVGHDWGQTKPSEDFTYIDVSAIDNQRGIVAEGASIVSAANAPSRARKVVKMGTVIYSTVRPYLLNIAIIERNFDPAPIASTAFAILHPHDGVEAKFVYYFLRSPAFVAYVESVQSGIAYPAISDQKFFAASFPLAPTEEQKRIVAKVDELMALCDQLEAQQQERERRFPVLSRTCHARFAEAPTLTNLNRIFDETGTVSPDDLRKTIINFAVQGFLVNQEPTDEPAFDAWARIQKVRLAAGEKDFGSLHEDEAPFAIPKGWCWIKMGNLALSSDSGWSPQCESTPRNGTNWGVLKVSAVSWDDFNPDENKELPAGMSPRPECEVHNGDFLLSRANTEELVARSVVVTTTPPHLMMSDKIVRFTFPEELEKRYINFANSATFARSHYAKHASGTSSSMKNVGRGTMCNLAIPFPPLAEQRRIVAKVDELMSLVDQLEAQQQERNKLAEAFAKACVASFTGTTQLERPEKMKAPKTELISVLTIGKLPNSKAKAPLAWLLVERAKGALPAKSLWQQSELTIDAFYQQLKAEIAQGWIAPPAEAEMKVQKEDSTLPAPKPSLAQLQPLLDDQVSRGIEINRMLADMAPRSKRKPRP